MYKLLNEKYQKTNWSDSNSVKEYAEYSLELLKRLYIKSSND